MPECLGGFMTRRYIIINPLPYVNVVFFYLCSHVHLHFLIFFHFLIFISAFYVLSTVIMTE